MKPNNKLHIEHSSKSQIEKIKGLTIPVMAIFLSILFFLVDQLRPLWIGIEKYPPISNGSDFYIESSILLGGIIALILIAEIFTYFFIQKGRIDISSVSFITALQEKQRYSLYFLFPLTLLFEELLFRGIIFEILFNFFSYFLAIFISAGIFGIYHIHILITQRDWTLGSIFIIYSFLLGLLLGKVVIFFGILGCWLVHIVIVSYIYLRWNAIYTKFENYC